MNHELLEALKNCNFEAVKEYVETNPETWSREFNTLEGGPLRFVCLNDDADKQEERLNLVKYLTNLYPEFIWCADDDGYQAIHFAAMRGHLNIIRHFHEIDSSSIYAKNAHQVTVLHCACAHGHTELVRSLLEINPNSAWDFQDDGTTALHLACENGYVDIIQIILYFHQWSPYAMDANGNYPFNLVGENEEVQNILANYQHIIAEYFDNQEVSSLSEPGLLAAAFHLVSINEHDNQHPSTNYLGDAPPDLPQG